MHVYRDISTSQDQVLKKSRELLDKDRGSSAVANPEGMFHSHKMQGVGDIYMNKKISIHDFTNF